MAPPAKPDCSRKSASLSRSDCRSTASASSGLYFEYVWKRMIAACICVGESASVLRRTSLSSDDAIRPLALPESVPDAAHASELPDLLDGADAVAGRRVDAQHGARLAGTRV